MAHEAGADPGVSAGYLGKSRAWYYKTFQDSRLEISGALYHPEIPYPRRHERQESIEVAQEIGADPSVRSRLSGIEPKMVL